MPLPSVTNQSIIDAIKYIDENGVPDKNKRSVYDFVIGQKKYPQNISK